MKCMLYNLEFLSQAVARGLFSPSSANALEACTLMMEWKQEHYHVLAQTTVSYVRKKNLKRPGVVTDN